MAQKRNETSELQVIHHASLKPYISTAAEYAGVMLSCNSFNPSSFGGHGKCWKHCKVTINPVKTLLVSNCNCKPMNMYGCDANLHCFQHILCPAFNTKSFGGHGKCWKHWKITSNPVPALPSNLSYHSLSNCNPWICGYDVSFQCFQHFRTLRAREVLKALRGNPKPCVHSECHPLTALIVSKLQPQTK